MQHFTKAVLAIAGIMASAASAVAQQTTVNDRLLGAWSLTATYLLEEDGKKDDPWGSNVQGTMTFTPGNRFAFMIIGADRDKSAANNPRVPVGPLVGHFGSYSVDEAGKSITLHVERSTFPGFDGANFKLNIPSL